MERLMRLRQPMAVVALVGLALHLVLLLGLTAASRAEYDLVAADLAFSLADPVLLLLLTALVVTCWAVEPTPHARGLTIGALVLIALTLGAFVAAGVAALIAEATTAVAILVPQSVASLVTGIVALGTTIALLGRPAERSTPQTGPIRTELRSEPESEPAPDPDLQPTWTTDQAVGTVWRRAGDASPSTAATDWDASGASGGSWSADPAPELRNRSES